jgi:mRNA interferase RelE/StbE
VNYTVSLTPAAQRQYRRLSSQVQSRLDAAMQRLENDPRPLGCLKLQGRDEWRIRVGDYRIVYQIDDAARTVTITDIFHRSRGYD